jgi:hypothetical protein
MGDIGPVDLQILEAHGPYMSDSDEAEIIRRIVESDDVADLALRTCMCGRRLDGFDDYFTHLRSVLATETTHA